mmetsp:Transcript_74347/g.149682  ORF Transcript_74347/g.149682 Transcript_74347/m.149682 type:complete len:463 (+) Transcript_74347:446-1834(+)
MQSNGFAFCADELDDMERDARSFVMSMIERPERRNRILEALRIVDPWILPTTTDRSIYFSRLMLPMMKDDKTSQQEHATLAHLFLFTVSFGADFGQKEEFALQVHIMLELGRSEAMLYLKELDSTIGKDESHPVLLALQHLDTPKLLQERLEHQSTDEVDQDIKLRTLCLFSEHGLLSHWDEWMQDRFISRLLIFQEKTGSKYIKQIFRFFATLDSKQLANLPLDNFRTKIEFSSDVEPYWPLLQTLSASSQFRAMFFSEGLVRALLRAWEYDLRDNNGTMGWAMWNLLSQNKHAWGMWANLAESLPKFFFWNDFAVAFKEKVKYIERSRRNCSSITEMKLPFEISFIVLELKLNRRCMMNPSEVRYIQDSIGPVFCCGRCVQTTANDLRNNIISPHSIPKIKVFCWNGGIRTEDNRRLFAFKEAGVHSIPVEWTSFELVDRSKITSQNDGTSVRVRGGGCR